MSKPWRSVNPQYDLLCQSLAANFAMDWWDDGKLSVVPDNAMRKGDACLGVAREHAWLSWAQKCVKFKVIVFCA